MVSVWEGLGRYLVSLVLGPLGFGECLVAAFIDGSVPEVSRGLPGKDQHSPTFA